MEQLENLVGTTLDGRYLLQTVVGHGASAVIFSAKDLLLDRTVALKMLRSEAVSATALQNETREAFLARTEEARRINRSAFIQESRAAARLSHPNIVTIFDVCPYTGNPYIVMELIRGIPLSERMAEHGTLPTSEVLAVACAVLEALICAHENGVVHRDIKGQNILLLPQGGVKVMDFGIAEIGGRGACSLAGKVLGTADTMSPEQASGAVVDARSDLYSLGALMYRMATGHFPFEDDDPQTVAFLHRAELPRYPSTWNPEIPRGLEQIILTALEKDPKNRFQSAASMLAAVKKLMKNPHRVFRRFSEKKPLVLPSLRRTAFFPVLCGSAAALVILCLIFAFFGLFSVPNVTILELPSCVERHYENEVRVSLDPRIKTELRYALRTDLPAGTVISQSPEAGTCWRIDEHFDDQILYLTVVTHDAGQITG